MQVPPAEPRASCRGPQSLILSLSLPSLGNTELKCCSLVSLEFLFAGAESRRTCLHSWQRSPCAHGGVALTLPHLGGSQRRLCFGKGLGIAVGAPQRQAGMGSLCFRAAPEALLSLSQALCLSGCSGQASIPSWLTPRRKQCSTLTWPWQ